MQRTLLALSLVVIFAGLVVACGPSSPATPEIHVEDAWSRPAPAGGTGAVYVTIMNEGGTVDTLLDAQSDVAEAVELHETKLENDVMRMQPASSVEVPAGGQTKFEPGSFHVMLIGLQQDLKAGDHFEIILQFQTSGNIPVEVGVSNSTLP